MPKVETWLTPKQIQYIEATKGDRSRSEWIKEAVQQKIDREIESLIQAVEREK